MATQKSVVESFVRSHPPPAKIQSGSAIHQEEIMACPSIGITTTPTLSRFIYYKILTLVPVTAALTTILRHGETPLWAFLYVGLCLAHAGIMNAKKCPHCPYYRMGERTFACFIWWGTPKLWPNRDGPEPGWVKHYALFGVSVLTLFPMYWLWQEWPFLVTYLLGIGGLVTSIFLNECSRCLHFECGNCGVPEDLRREYRATMV